MREAPKHARDVIVNLRVAGHSQADHEVVQRRVALALSPHEHDTVESIPHEKLRLSRFLLRND